jgi:hypothetical protein
MRVMDGVCNVFNILVIILHLQKISGEFSLQIHNAEIFRCYKKNTAIRSVWWTSQNLQ